MIIYGYCLLQGANYLSDGSEMLLEILDPGLIGGERPPTAPTRMPTRLATTVARPNLRNLVSRSLSISTAPSGRNRPQCPDITVFGSSSVCSQDSIRQTCTSATDRSVLAGLLLPILGALPDALIILVSGLGGTREEAQEQVRTPAVAMALLARAPCSGGCWTT